MVDQLTALKVTYKETTGTEFINPDAPPAAPKVVKTEKKDTKAAAPKAVTAVEPVVAVHAPQSHAPLKRPDFVSPGPKVTANVKQSASEVPSLQDVLTGADGNLDVNLLEARLIVYSYVGGYLPSKDDNTYVSCF